MGINLESKCVGMSTGWETQITWRDISPTLITPALFTSLIRFRLCCWAIEVNRPKGRARAVRHCPMCEREATEDEYHVLMECSAYGGLRQEIRQAGDFLEGNMAAVMSMCNQRRLAKVLHEIRRMRGTFSGETV
ncbi:hypothetical protein Vafri_11940 [Volvox africanus]|uniref:Uncharacterized protein n=1 Tax=Volvox africanus TaxID=51714 RepID=A0A8J4B944_9CHLO|nr:hypothetical protein Vafri_11940 [Volvox africanus]